MLGKYIYLVYEVNYGITECDSVEKNDIIAFNNFQDSIAEANERIEKYSNQQNTFIKDNLFDGWKEDGSNYCSFYEVKPNGNYGASFEIRIDKIQLI